MSRLQVGESQCSFSFARPTVTYNAIYLEIMTHVNCGVAVAAALRRAALPLTPWATWL
jgi:hypothetical protein